MSTPTRALLLDMFPRRHAAAKHKIMAYLCAVNGPVPLADVVRAAWGSYSDVNRHNLLTQLTALRRRLRLAFPGYIWLSVEPWPGFDDVVIILCAAQIDLE